MPCKICIIGAGSAIFSLNLIKDICVNKHFEKYFAEGEQNVQKIRRVTEDHSVKVSEVFSTMPSDEGHKNV